MKMCALCEERIADKKNTHYLSDGIIRQTLNVNGCNKRGYGSFCSFRTDSPYITYGFQQNVSPDEIQKELGHPANDLEIDNARNNKAFSVDYVFCSHCEKLFGRIEDDFTQRVLNKVRDKDLPIGAFPLPEAILIRKFFYLQYLRTHLCNPEFRLSDNLHKLFRKIILNEIIDEATIKSIPIKVSFMLTPTKVAHTENLVGMATGSNPYIIFMDEFVIQLFDNAESVRFIPLFGLNTEDKYQQQINYQEDAFEFSIISNEERKLFLDSFHDENAKKKKTEWIQLLIKMHVARTGDYPNPIVFQKFNSLLLKRDFYMNAYSEESMMQVFEECIK